MVDRGRRRTSLFALPLLIGLGLTLGPALAPATIEEQRSRLPPPAFECGDPVVGVWQAHVHYAHVGQWYLFELNIERDPAGDGLLRGTIRAEFWDGEADRSQPPLCDEPGWRNAVFEQAKGRVDQLTLSFDAIDWRDLEICGRPLRGGYLLDHFSGTIEPERMEFQSLLNADAPEWRDVPTVFRRVRCQAGPEREPTPRIIVEPPPYQPPEREGCGLRN